MSLRRRPRGRILAVLAAGILAAVALVAVIVVIRQPVPVTARTLRIPVVDGPRPRGQPGRGSRPGR